MHLVSESMQSITKDPGLTSLKAICIHTNLTHATYITFRAQNCAEFGVAIA